MNLSLTEILLLVILVFVFLTFVASLRSLFYHMAQSAKIEMDDDKIIIKVEQAGRVVYQGDFDSAPEYIQKLYRDKKEEMQRLMNA